MLWEHEQQASVCTAFSSSPELLRQRNTENMFLLLLENTGGKNESNLLAPSFRQQLLLVPCFLSG